MRSCVKRDAIIPEKLEGKKDMISKDLEMKKKHDDMEKSYVPQMDFVAVTEFRKQIIERIKKYL